MNEWTSSVSCQAEDTILIRGYAIEDIIGRLSYTEALYLTLRGELPGEKECRMLDAALCSILDYAKGPAPVTARIVISANPQIGAALAAGILAQGAHAVSPQDAGSLLESLAQCLRDGSSINTIAKEAVAEALDAKRRLPGMGHPSAMKADPRADMLKHVATETGYWKDRCRLMEALQREYATATSRQLVINVDGMLGAVLGDMGFSAPEMAAIAAISMLPGIAANAVEEMRAGSRIRMVRDMEYRGPSRRKVPKKDQRD